MTIEHKEFIGTYSPVYDEGFCQHLISEFERHMDMRIGYNRQESEGALKHVKNDYAIIGNARNISFSDFNGEDTVRYFFNGLQTCYQKYSNEYSVIKDAKLYCNSMKIQKTSSGGGYHVWHGEQAGDVGATRGLFYILYLNTLPPEACGETEFLYQQRRVDAVENTMIISPAAFTHAHRGNPVYGDHHKYIVTGWFLYE